MSRLPASQRTIVSRLLRPELGPLYQGEPQGAVESAIRTFRVERMRLAGGTALAIQASGDQLCSPTGNCAFWVVDAQRRRILLKASAIQMYTLDRASSSRMPDIITRMHGSSTESDLTRWRYEGASYRRSECASAEYADAEGNSYPEPKFTPHPCTEGNDNSR